jgi:multicomponent Na+:H+ antiporter subunit C
MELILSLLVGVLFGTAVYTMLRRSIVRLAIGVSLLGHATNLLIFTVGGVSRVGPPVAEEGEVRPLFGAADPVPQALILTAIVISFAVLAFMLVLIQRVYQSVGSDDSDDMAASR